MKTENIVSAFRSVDRADFLPEPLRSGASRDIPLPIGFSQTNSQPSTVSFMLELLQPKEGSTVLDVGSGSGWTTALLAVAVSPSGHVTAIERIPELLVMGRENVEKYGFISSGRVKMLLGDGWKGFPPDGPYDRILVSAMATRIPVHLVEQLKTGGIMVVPVYNDICRIVKNPDSSCERENFSGFVFVPLVEEPPS